MAVEYKIIVNVERLSKTQNMNEEQIVKAVVYIISHQLEFMKDDWYIDTINHEVEFKKFKTSEDIAKKFNEFMSSSKKMGGNSV